MITSGEFDPRLLLTVSSDEAKSSPKKKLNINKITMQNRCDRMVDDRTRPSTNRE